MMGLLEQLGFWAADYFFIALILMVASWSLCRLLRQPVERLAIYWATTVALAVLAPIVALDARTHLSLNVIRAPALTDAPLALSRHVVEARPDSVNSRTEPMLQFEPPARATAPQPQDERHAPVAPVEQQTAQSDPPPVISNAAATQERAMWAIVVGSVVLFVATLTGCWCIIGSWRLRRICRTSERPCAELSDCWSQQLGGRGWQPVLRITSHLHSPAATGLLYPKIFLPRALVQQSSARVIRATLAHEWTHVRRGDLWLLALCRALSLLLHAHPMFWWLKRQIRDDQELVADAAVKDYVEPMLYAEVLVRWAQALAPPRLPLGVTAGAWHRPSQLSRRVAVLLSDRVRVATSCSVRWFGVALIAIGVPGVLLSLVTLQAIPGAHAGEDDASDEGAGAEKVTVRVAGKCLDENGDPLEGVAVTLAHIEGRSARVIKQTKSQADGTYDFGHVPGLAPDEQKGLQVTASHEGRASAGTYVWSQSQGTLSKKVLTLGPATTLKGRVVDQDNNPVEGAGVTAWPFYTDGFRSARTDADGRYVIDDVAPWKPEPMPAEGGVTEVASAVFFWIDHPDYGRKRAAYSRLPATVDAQLEPAAKIIGRVLFGDTGKPAPGVQVAIQGLDVGGYATATTDEQGNYTLSSLVTDRYNVWADAKDWTVEALDSYDVQAGKTYRPNPLRLVKGVFLEGRVIDVATGRPPKFTKEDNADVAWYGPARPRSGAACQSVPINEDGSFRIRVAPGTVYPYFRSHDTWKSEASNRDYMRGVEVEAGEDPQPLLFLVRHRDVPENAPRAVADPHEHVFDPNKSPREAIKELGGWVETKEIDGEERVVQVNMVYHHTKEGKRLDNDKMSDAALYYVSEFPYLKELLLHRKQATDEALASIRDLPNIERVYIWDGELVTDEGAAHLASLPNLKYLHLSGSQVTDEAFAYLAEAVNLEGLSMQETSLTNAALAHIRGLTNLKQLVVGRGDIRVTDEGLQHLAGLKQLNMLGLQGAEITDDGLEHLRGLKNLNTLWLPQTGVTAKGVQALQQWLPAVRVTGVRGVDRPLRGAGAREEPDRRRFLDPPELAYLAWQRSQPRPREVVGAIWNPRSRSVQGERAELLGRTYDFPVKRRENAVEPLLIWFRANSPLKVRPIMVKVVGHEKTQSFAANEAKQGYRLSNVAPMAPYEWPAKISLEIKYAIEAPQTLFELDTLPAEKQPFPADLDVEWTWHINEQGQFVSTLRSYKAAKDEWLRKYGVELYGKGRKLRRARGLVRPYDDRIEDVDTYRIDADDVELVRLTRVRYRKSVIEDVPIRLDLIPEAPAESR